MSYVILVRNPRNDRIIAITDGSIESDDPPIAVYETEEEAEEAAAHTTACQAWPYSIVEAP